MGTAARKKTKSSRDLADIKIYGPAAARHHWDKLQKELKAGASGRVVLQLMAPLRAFSWMLEEGEDAEFRLLRKKHVGLAQQGIEAIANGNDEGAGVAIQTYEADAASSSDQPWVKKPSKRQLEAQQKASADRSKLNKFFSTAD